MMVSMISASLFFSNRRPFSRRKRARNNSHVRGESFIFSEPFNVKSVALLCVCASVLFFCFQKALCEDTEAKEHNTEAESMESVHIRGQFSQKNVRNRGF